jgi:hypothetical protein
VRNIVAATKKSQMITPHLHIKIIKLIDAHEKCKRGIFDTKKGDLPDERRDKNRWRGKEL